MRPRGGQLQGMKQVNSGVSQHGSSYQEQGYTFKTRLGSWQNRFRSSYTWVIFNSIAVWGKNLSNCQLMIEARSISTSLQLWKVIWKETDPAMWGHLTLGLQVSTASVSLINSCLLMCLCAFSYRASPVLASEQVLRAFQTILVMSCSWRSVGTECYKNKENNLRDGLELPGGPPLCHS